MKAGTMMPSTYLKKEDIGTGKLMTINAFAQENVAPEGKPDEMKWVMYFREAQKGLVLNPTNLELCTRAMGGDDETDHWVGRQVVLYVDHNVSYGGKLIGGIRIRGPRPAAAQAMQPPTQPGPSASAMSQQHGWQPANAASAAVRPYGDGTPPHYSAPSPQQEHAPAAGFDDNDIPFAKRHWKEG